MTKEQKYIQNYSQTYVPKYITNNSMLMYFAALAICSTIYAANLLELRWIILGLIEVCGFFYFSNKLSKILVSTKPRIFIKNIFYIGLLVRVVWVIVSYFLYIYWTDTPFSIEAADELFYDDVAHYGANLLRDGQFNIYNGIEMYAGRIGFSDMGYPIYLSIIYCLFFDSILIARIIKAVFGAWTAVLIYKLATRNFGETVGRMAGILCMLMPNLIYYCSFQLKEVEMVFLTVLFAERADYLLRLNKISWKSLLLLMAIPAYMFMIRTALAAVLVLAFFCALVLSSERIISWGRRILLIIMATLFLLVIFFSDTAIGQDVKHMWNIGNTTQKANMEWRSERGSREGTLNQSFARYASSAVFAPMIFTIPFPTMVETPGQENSKLINGGNFIKNIISYFTIIALFIMLSNKKWRKHVLFLAIILGYLVVLVFSNFAQSERFHLPILPFHMILAAYGISHIREKLFIKKYFKYWCLLIFIAIVAWNWFKLAGRGMI